MGAKETKPSSISYEDAIKRVSGNELRRIKEAFKKSSGPGRSLLSQSTFQQDVLCESVPPFIAELIYIGCGGTPKGIGFKELFCGLVLLTHGTEEEKIKFLWNLYCNDSGQYILKSDYTKCISVHSPGYNDLQSSAISLFAQSDRVNFDQFKDWAHSHKNSTVLSKWILSENAIYLTSELETPTFYQSLAGVTHLEEHDIGDLEKEFWKLKNCSFNGLLDLYLVGPLLSPPIPKTALAGLFSAFDENRDGHIDFKELCCGVSAACRGPNVERSKFCFKIFDIDRDGLLNPHEIDQMIDILIFVAKESPNSNNFVTVTKTAVMNDILSFAKKNNGEEKGKENIEDENLKLEDFLMWTVESTMNLIQTFLDLTFEVCHIVFGLRPQCKHLENDIVRGWLLREEKRGYRVGQFWYLISKDWWNSWLHYTQDYPLTPCSYCKKSALTTNQRQFGIDEAIVCDESYNSTESGVGGSSDLHTTPDTSSLGSTNSGISYNRRSYHSKPGPIDNTNLVIPNELKNIKNLTGEGGHLKKDTPLVQGNDFELVPKSLWKALCRWYGDMLPLPRQVIQPPNSMQVELELYPLKIRILLHQTLTTNIPSIATNWGGAGATLGGYSSITSVPSSVLQPPKRYLAYLAAFSRLATVKQIGEFLCEQLKLKPEDIRIWHIFSPEDIPVLLEEENMTLKELTIKNNDQILLEIRNKDLTWPEELGSLTLNNHTSSHMDRRLTRASIQSVHANGATGLHNLGNTCFMNSALQVLFNTQALTQYFKRGMHLYELNTTNKLGTKGQLAQRYCELLNEVWTATTRSVAPLKLRFCVTKYASQFAGGGQHDSQELLEWLLDALHEDLNRVTEKPYSELKDSDGRPDEDVAAEAWGQHHSRNQSIVIDLFYGQLKSKVSCLCCGRESVRMDPFSLLSLPLPVENYLYYEVLVILLDGSIPIKYGIRLNYDGKYFDLKKSLSPYCNLNPSYMLLCEISNSQIRNIFKDNDDLKIKPINPSDLYIYQLPENSANGSHSRTSSMLGVNIEKGLKDIQRSSALTVGPENTIINNSSSTATTTTSSLSLCSTTIPSQPHSNSVQIKGCKNCNNFKEITSVTVLDDLEDLEIEKDKRKVRRCFGNTMCMPQNLLCFKQEAEMSVSPENTFVPSNNHVQNFTNQLHHNYNRKRVSTANLLNETPPSGNNSSDEASLSHQHTTNNLNHSRTRTESYSEDEENEDEDTGAVPGLFSRNSSKHYKVGKYLVALHRKLTRQDTYFLSYQKTRPSLFGVPLLIPCSESGTNKELYCAVWLQVNRLLSPLPPSADQSNHAADCDDSLGYDFPFTCRAVTKDGLTCALCPWSNFCRGCEIPCNDEFLLQGTLIQSSTVTSNSPNLNSTGSRINFNGAIHIAIDWDPTALHLRYQCTRERLWTEHESVQRCRREQSEPVDLHHCLRAFTSEEKLEEWYYCSHCKGKTQATKKLQIWKLPPVLIVHLKRFNCVNNNRWVKSQKAVHFPFDDFDPTPYLASIPQETILRHNDLKMRNNSNLCNENCEEVDNETEPEDEVVEGNKSKEDFCGNSITKNEPSEVSYEKPEHNSNVIKDKHTALLRPRKLSTEKVQKRRRLISTSLTKTPIVDEELKDFHNHKLKAGSDRLDLKYKLYAVVSHSGMLNGGHYVSYAANPNGYWYCYNDSSCREIRERPNIDPSSAYLLFYERKNLDNETYLPNVEGKSIPNGFAGLNGTSELDENDSELKKNCVIA